MTTNERENCLTPLRVLDMTENGCEICGKILGDLGADVIKIEPLGGSSSRRIGPFLKDIPDPQKSLFWFAYNTSKRGITLNINTSDGQQIFRRLVETADMVIESFSPGYLDSLGIGYQALSQINPGIILISITPFGQDGPKAHYKGSDLTAWAASSGLFVTGDPDRSPVWISYPQPHTHAGAEACAGALIAYWDRLSTGEGQHVDVSIQDTFFWSTEQARLQGYDITRGVYHRSGGKTLLASGVGRRQVFACQDGFVAYEIIGGGLANMVASTRSMVLWMAEEEMAPDWLVNFDWATEYDTSKITQEEIDRIEREFEKFILTKTKTELFNQALNRGIILVPVNSIEDIGEFEHLKVRHFWVDVEHDDLNCTLPYCGFLNNAFSETPGTIERRAPLIGEHNLDIYEGDLGLSREKISVLKNAGVI